MAFYAVLPIVSVRISDILLKISKALKFHPVKIIFALLVFAT